MPNVEGLSELSIYYAKRFFQLYSELSQNSPQVVENLCSVPRGHHCYSIGRFSKEPEKSLFYVRDDYKWVKQICMSIKKRQ